MGFTFISSQTLSYSETSLWQDIDVSAYCPEGTTGVMIHIVIGSSARNIGLRKKGSTDDIKTANGATQQAYGYVGVDANRVLQVHVQSGTGVTFYLKGYFDSDAVFFTNAIDKSLGTTNTWLDIDISGDTGDDTAIGAILEIHASSTYTVGFRKNGSTDDRYNSPTTHSWAIIGVDDNEIFESRISNTNSDCKLIGYIKAGFTFNTNATDLSLSTAAEWLDLAALPAGANGGIIQVYTTNFLDAFGLRKNGSAEDIYKDNNALNFAIIECDANGVIEGKIENATRDKFLLIGYFSEAKETILSPFPSFRQGG